MGLFSKLFGASGPKAEPLNVPETATPREVIAIAIRSVTQKAGGNCATLDLDTDPNIWVQIMDLTINCHYPHRESPEWRFPELCHLPMVSGLEGYEAGVFMTVGLTDMNESAIATWIARYFRQVLAVDLEIGKLRLRMEDL